VQAAVTPLGDDGIQIIPGFLIVNMYTAVGWVIVVLSVLCFVLLLPSFFNEKHIAAKEAMCKQGISLSLSGIFSLLLL
jgi:MFS transporter, ceroid-lipofuscinosis neuronal protein 7